MNLVAKEFVAARDDERGVLVLSQFTGTARELTEALIVNPYYLDEAAGALATALAMSPEEQGARMRSMRSYLAEFNVYRWAGRMLVDAARMRHRKRVLEPHRAFIIERLSQVSHLTLHDLKAELAARGVRVSHNTVWEFLLREGLRFKKNAVRP